MCVLLRRTTSTPTTTPWNLYGNMGASAQLEALLFVKAFLFDASWMLALLSIALGLELWTEHLCLSGTHEKRWQK